MNHKIVFVYSHSKPEMLEHDGLMTAVQQLGWETFNLADDKATTYVGDMWVGWGPFGGDVDEYLKAMPNPKALCMSAYMEPVHSEYDVVFYETEYAKRFLEEKGCTSKLIHAFGVDRNIWKPWSSMPPKVWDYISVGGWNTWHRYEKLAQKSGLNLAVGGIMRENLQQSLSLMVSAALSGWMVSDEVDAITLSLFYSMSRQAYFPAEFGQERSVLEARSCGIPVEVEPDNPKLNELLTSPIWGVDYYKEQLKKGVELCLSAEK